MTIPVAAPVADVLAATVPGCPHLPPCPAAEAVDHDAAHVMFHDYVAGLSVLCNHVVVYDDTGETLPDCTAVAPHRPGVPHCTNQSHGHACPCAEGLSDV